MRGNRSYRPEAIPLPPGARPIGEGIEAAKGGHAFVHYATDESAEAVEEFFRAAMPQAGWKESQTSSAWPTDDGGRVSAYSNDKGNWCMIAVSEGADGTVISVLHVRRLAAENLRQPGRFEKEASR